MTQEAADALHMRHALRLAERGLGRTWPNPSVGCVLLRKDGVMAGRGWTQPGGRPHAETVALAAAGDDAQGATAFVTLEPCAHVGQTGPCAQSLIDGGVARVVVAAQDPDPRVNGQGIAMLRAAGIAVTAGVLAAEARALNAGFFLRVLTGRPLVTLKAAVSLDGRIALANGASQWITGPQARRLGQGLRAQNDAIVTGIGTVLADDPALTCRLPGLRDASPVRVVLDRLGRTPPAAKLLTQPLAAPVLVMVGQACPADRIHALTGAGATVIACQTGESGRLDLGDILSRLAARGLTRVLVEGGGRLAASFLNADLADRIACFRAPVILGGDAQGMAAEMGLNSLAQARRFRRTQALSCGPDLLEMYEKDA